MEDRLDDLGEVRSKARVVELADEALVALEERRQHADVELACSGTWIDGRLRGDVSGRP
ncbi:MAG: hypothetical protein M3389_05750 [Actinomycetota bacterium]|nr:hypothetical protein [Actinomycetota bacterium]